MKQWNRVLGLMTLGALGLFGCQESEQYLITPFKVACEGVGPQFCVLGLKEETGEGTLFYEGINGFTFRWGVLQTIRVSEVEVANPPEDASSIRYVLEEFVKAEPVPEEATFSLYITRDYLRGTRANGYSLIDSTRVTFASSAVCDALEQKLGDAAKFTLKMDYPATEGEPLIITGVD